MGRNGKLQRLPASRRRCVKVRRRPHQLVRLMLAGLDRCLRRLTCSFSVVSALLDAAFDVSLCVVSALVDVRRCCQAQRVCCSVCLQVHKLDRFSTARAEVSTYVKRCDNHSAAFEQHCIECSQPFHFSSTLATELIFDLKRFLRFLEIDRTGLRCHTR